MKFCSLDLETTGLDFAHDEVIQFAGWIFEYIFGVPGSYKVLGTFNYYLNTDRPIDPDAAKANGITHTLLQCLSNGLYPEDQKESLEKVLSRSDLAWVGHNIDNFDLIMLRTYCRRHDILMTEPLGTFDTMQLAMKNISQVRHSNKWLFHYVLKGHGLTENTVKSMFDACVGSATHTYHDALWDSFVTMFNFVGLEKEFKLAG